MYFYATSNLSQAVTFPIANCGPSSVAFFLGIVYKEISGTRNLLITVTGILLAIIGTVLCGLSK
jgi:hypothetical protein